MKRNSIFPIVLLSIIFLAGCENKENKKITGVWKLIVMKINNTPLSGSSLGNWLWEFNEEGGYLINVAGEVEKGTYSIQDGKLTMKSVTHQERPQQIYTISKIDSVNLSLSSKTDKNTSSLTFIKLKEGEQGESD